MQPERVLFFRRPEIIQLFIAANVQRTDHDRGLTCVLGTSSIEDIIGYMILTLPKALALRMADSWVWNGSVRSRLIRMAR